MIKTNIKSVFSGSSIDSTTLPDFKISKNVNKPVLKQPLLTDLEDNVKTKTWTYVYTPEDVSETVSGYQHASYNSVNKNHNYKWSETKKELKLLMKKMLRLIEKK